MSLFIRSSALLVFFALLSTNILFGQILNRVNDILATKSFLGFRVLADSLAKSDKIGNTYWGPVRDLTNNHREGTFFFWYQVPVEGKQATYRVFAYRAAFIIRGTQIIYYELSERKDKMDEDKWISYFELVDSFRNNYEYKILKDSFRSIFHAELDKEGLFDTHNIYGSSCGIGGTIPESRKQVNSFIVNKNKTELVKWLQSTNTERQIYAVFGLHKLQKMGIKLTEMEIKMIDFVLNKTGTLNVCRGCIFSTTDISAVTQEFKF